MVRIKLFAISELVSGNRPFGGFFDFFSSFFLEIDLIFGNYKELLNENKILVKEIIPSLNECRMCQSLKCKYCLKFSITCSRCPKDKCFNCYKFNKSKDILINSGEFFISNYVKNFWFDYFNVSDLTNYFLNMDVNELVKEKNTLEIIQNNNEIISNTKK